jgi:titin
MAAPTQVVSLSADLNTIQLSWTQPNLYGAELQRYKLYVGGVLYNPCTIGLGCVVSGLTGGQLYTIQISAVSDFGEGVLSPLVSMYPASSPSTPSTPVVTVASSAPSITFEWTNPTSTGWVLNGYEFEITEDGGAATVFTATTAEITSNPPSITLTSSTSTWLAVSVAKQYALCVKIVTSFGTSACSSYSSTTVVPYGYTLSIPIFDSTAAVTRHADPLVDGQVKITWPAVTSTGGDSSVTYELKALLSTATSDAGALNPTTANTFYTFTVPSGEVWVFSARAKNRRGEYTAYIGTATLRSCGAPGAPTGLTANQQGSSSFFVLEWSAPSNTGGSAVTSYRVFAGGVEITTANIQILTTTSYKVSVPGGTSSTVFTVRAVTSCGESASSSSATSR